MLWHSVAAGNFGVGALTVGNLALARAAAARASMVPEFTVFGPVERGTPYVAAPDVALRSITRRYLLGTAGYRADLKNLDIMLDISAGDSFGDIYAEKRFAYMVLTKALAIRAGLPLILSPQTIGPFSRQPHTMAAGWVCRRSAQVFARDPISMEVLARIAPGARATQVVDVAFALPFDRAPARGGGPVRVGLNVSRLLMHRAVAGNNVYGLSYDYAALTRAIITAFLAMPDVEVHLVPHVVAPGQPYDDDGAAADALKAEFPALVRHPDFAGPSDAKGFISSLDFLVGGRMHATIGAYSAGVPVVPVSYSRKFEGLYGGLDYPWFVPSKGMDTDTAIAFVLDAFARRAELATAITRGTPVIAAGLETYTAALAREFAAAAA